MAITAITINQDNIVSGSNLVAIHCPVAFIADVDYTGLAPDECNVEIYDSSMVLLDTYRAIPYRDTTATQREFIFLAEKAIKSLMDSFDDFLQLTDTLEYVEGLTLECYIRFVDPDTPTTYDEVLIDFAHASKQFGESVNMSEQFNNDSGTYYAVQDGIVYAYFYNNDITNLISVNGPAIIEGNALDYDDSIFTDFDDTTFTINTAV